MVLASLASRAHILRFGANEFAVVGEGGIRVCISARFMCTLIMLTFEWPWHMHGVFESDHGIAFLHALSSLMSATMLMSDVCCLRCASLRY